MAPETRLEQPLCTPGMVVSAPWPGPAQPCWGLCAALLLLPLSPQEPCGAGWCFQPKAHHPPAVPPSRSSCTGLSHTLAALW